MIKISLGEKRSNLSGSKSSLYLLLGTVLFALIITLVATERQRLLSIANTPSSGAETTTAGNACDVLGIDFGGSPADAINLMGYEDNAKYFKADMGVTTTVVCKDTDISKGILDTVQSSTNARKHIFKLGNANAADPNCHLTSAEAINKINQITETYADQLGSEIFVVPTNEPLTEVGVWFGSEDASGVRDGKWLANVIAGVSGKSQKYLVFPGFNYHIPEMRESYMRGFIQSYIDSGGSFDHFASYGLSIQYDSTTLSFSERIQMYKDLLAEYGVNDPMIELYGANQINATPTTDGYADNLLQAVADHSDSIAGVYIFTPWGWTGSAQESGVSNLQMPEEVWDYMFEECSSIEDEFKPEVKQSEKAFNGNIRKYEDMQTCEKNNISGDIGIMQLEGEYDDVFAGVVMEYEDGLYKTRPVITMQISMSLLNWMQESDLAGTDANPILSPVGSDKQVIMDTSDMTKELSGELKVELSNDAEFSYPMSTLGTAIASMIWRATNFDAGSLSLNELEPRFRSRSASVESNRFTTVNEAGGNKPNSIVKRADAVCSGKVTNVNTSDTIVGPEIIMRDKMMEYTYQEFLDLIRADIVDGGGNPETGTVSGTPYYKVDGRSIEEVFFTENVIIEGAAEALAQIYREEIKKNPWPNYQVIHNRRGGIKLEVRKTLYDGGVYKDRDEYSELYSTEGDLRVYIPESLSISPTQSQGMGVTGKAVGAAVHYIEWMEQTLMMSQRMSLIFTDQVEDSYLKNRSADIENLKRVVNEGDGQEFARRLEETVLDPKKIYMCDDLDELAQEVARVGLYVDGGSTQLEQDVESMLTKTDCLGKHTDSDPLKDYLCSRDLLPKEICLDICIPIEEAAEDEYDPSEYTCLIRGANGAGIQCYQATAGALSHYQYASDLPLDLYTYDHVDYAVAPEDLKVIYWARSYTEGNAECGGKFVAESQSVPGLVYYFNHLDPNTVPYKEGDIVKKGADIGELIRLDNYCVKGAHIHFAVQYFENGFTKAEAALMRGAPVNPYTLLEAIGCGSVTCTPYDTENTAGLAAAIDAHDLFGNSTSETPIEGNYGSPDSMCPPSECAAALFGESGGINGVKYPACNENIMTQESGMSSEIANCDWSSNPKNAEILSTPLRSIKFLGMPVTTRQGAIEYFERAEQLFIEKYGEGEISENNYGKTFYTLPSYPDGYTFYQWGTFDVEHGGNHALGLAIDISGAPPTSVSRTDWGNYRIETYGMCDIGIPPEFVEVMEASGFRWGGRFSNENGYVNCPNPNGYCFDPMHFEVLPGCIVDEGKLGKLPEGENLYPPASESGIDYCETPDGEIGIVKSKLGSKTKIDSDFDYAKWFQGRSYAFEYNPGQKELHDAILDMCGINLPPCDLECKEEIKERVLAVANYYNSLGYSKSYPETSYTTQEISRFIDQMYTETQGMDDISFQVLIAIWFGETGFTPVYKNPNHASDIFGCGIGCGANKPKSFLDELACVTGKSTTDCGVFYPFQEESPGNFLEMYGPVLDGNSTFALKAILVLERLALIQGVPVDELRTGNSCNLYPSSAHDFVVGTWKQSVIDILYPVDPDFYLREQN